MKRVHYDENGQILGFYTPDDPGLPVPNIEITDDQWQRCYQNPKGWLVNPNTLALLEQATPIATGADLIALGQQQVKMITLGVRAIAAENADQYQLSGWNDKAARAARVLDSTASEVDLTVVQAEVDRRNKGETIVQLAQKQIDKAVKLAKAVSVIDGLESAALDQLPQAVLDDAVPDLLQSLEQDLDSHLAAITVSS